MLDPLQPVRAAVLLSRTATNNEGTAGTLIFKGAQLHCLELPWRDNRKSVSCISTGIYECKIRKSPKFGEVYEVMDVPGRRDILIHAANFAGTTELGWQSDLEGCIAPCRKIGTLQNKFGYAQLAGISSRSALGIFMHVMGKLPFTLQITQPDSWSL